ncbi:MAG: hypothetical protein NC037_04690 [Bacteroides sp.]|nr:hypothetical protein [Bacillota bacterium]MCM1393596.1 hypothetical protein [[Eubacterium] siraeum]MCM1455808.1 hypothetical protein [Bacteroides sp.]
MKKKLAVIFLTVLLTLSCVLGLCACNGARGDKLVLNKGSRPDYASIIGQDDKAVIDAALAQNASEDAKKAAVMALYDIANYSRKNTELSLMLQSSDAGISMGDVIMHGFNLKNGDKWYYQLATQATSSNGLSGFIGDIAGLLKVAYTSGDGNYYYIVVKGGKPQCDCTVDTFPYATFIIPDNKKPVLYNEDDFNKELHCLDNIHEINNMKFCADIIADGAKITYNAEEKYYSVEFSVDMSADGELLAQWFALPKEDMAVGGQTLKAYRYYNAVLEVWDNGYAKSFQSSSDRDAGMFASGKPVDKFEYIWKENEILNLLNEDKSISFIAHSKLDTIEDYIDYYSNPKLSKAQLSKLEIAGIVIGSIIAFALIVTIASVITVETLLKKGKLPKLASKRAAKKQKRLERKAAKADKKKIKENIENTDAERKNSEESESELNEKTDK